MGAHEHFWFHRGLLWEFASVVIAGSRGVSASVRLAQERPQSVSTNKPYGIIIGPGVLAPKLPYFLLEEILRNELGVDVFVADMGIFNMHSHTKMMRLASDFVSRTMNTYSLRQVVFVGHSIWGVIALMYLGNYPERVKRIFCIASPVCVGAQTPWSALAWAVSTFVVRPAFQQRVLENMYRRATPHAKKIATISTASDIILPNEATCFPGAENYVYDAKRDTRFPDYSSVLLDTHAGFHLHPYTLDIIFRTLCEEADEEN